MKRILIIKMSALGDIVHTFPAVSDLLKHYPDTEVDWLCEEPFTAVAALHQGVNEVIGHGRLRWKNSRFGYKTLTEQYQFYRKLRQKKYDLVIDAQGRVKSARVGWFSGAPVVGLDKNSATDSEVRFFYRQGFSVPRDMNAVERVRKLFAQALDYHYQGEPDFGIQGHTLDGSFPEYSGAWIFFHGTTWASKHWPEENWIDLLKQAKQEQQVVLLPWWGEQERQRAERMTTAAQWGIVLPQLSLWQLSGIITRCVSAVGVDTGLMHIAAACGVPTVSVFGSTSVALTAAHGKRVINLASSYSCSPCLKKVCPLNNDTPPCYAEVNAKRVMHAVRELTGNDCE